MIVSDDLSTYKPVVERLGVEHQVCPAHVRKNVWVRLDEIKGWDGYKAGIWRMLGELPESGGMELLGMERYVRGEPKLRRPVVDLCDKWRSLLCHRRERGVPGANNCAERVIDGRQDKVQDDQGIQEYGWNDERTGTDPVGMER